MTAAPGSKLKAALDKLSEQFKQVPVSRHTAGGKSMDQDFVLVVKNDWEEGSPGPILPFFTIGAHKGKFSTYAGGPPTGTAIWALRAPEDTLVSFLGSPQDKSKVWAEDVFKAQNERLDKAAKDNNPAEFFRIQSEFNFVDFLSGNPEKLVYDLDELVFMAYFVPKDTSKDDLDLKRDDIKSGDRVFARTRYGMSNSKYEASQRWSTYGDDFNNEVVDFTVKDAKTPAVYRIDFKFPGKVTLNPKDGTAKWVLSANDDTWIRLYDKTIKAKDAVTKGLITSNAKTQGETDWVVHLLTNLVEWMATMASNYNDQ